ncbi:MAG: glycosyltransferase family 9 protein [Fusobacterium gastrosuis]|uniref:glycosyltransferase family 9 protein n=1 Tax=Fusobacterium gastrosuis TaxID=1755100 RepID=UPI002A88A1C5|nr:glycosyltransferase family 9 protein [Fusobacterium gastrosuis]
MIRKINRIFQNFMREKRLKIGKYIWDRKEKKNYIKDDNFILDNNIKSILFLRHDGKIGDMVVNTLMFREIKKYYPFIKIGVVTKGGAVDIIKNNPYVDKIYNYKKNRRKIRELACELRDNKYDLLVDFSEMLRVNEMMLINLAKAKFNIGLDRESWQLFDLSINSGIDFEWEDHITDRYKAYLKKLGFLNNISTAYDVFFNRVDKYDNIFTNIKDEKILVLNPYGASKHKSFSTETLNEIIKFLAKIDIKVILIYYGDKYKELEALKEKNQNIYIPKYISSIEDSIYLISKANYVISPDTSIVHIASALNKKIVAVYPPKGGRFGVDHLVWAPKSINARIIFCKDRIEQYDEIDINTFDFEEMKKEILKMVED